MCRACSPPSRPPARRPARRAQRGLCGALLQTKADPAYLGRVSAVGGIVSLGIAPLSMPLSAAAVGAWGTAPVFVVSAAVCGLGGVVALCVRDLRRAELPR